MAGSTETTLGRELASVDADGPSGFERCLFAAALIAVSGYRPIVTGGDP
jgi:hypothetical protein